MKRNRRKRGGTLCENDGGSAGNIYSIPLPSLLKSYLLVCLAIYICLSRTIVNAAELDIRSSKCPHPSVPYASKYQNISGGPNDVSGSWKIKYICDSGYELFGDDVRECSEGRWPEDSLPICAVNVARHKPASASSQKGRGYASNAVDGKSSTVHEGKV